MDIAHKRRVFAILREVLDQPPSARETALAEACGGDEALVADVRVLLEGATSDMLDRGAAGVAARLVDADHDEGAPDEPEVGGWRIVRAVGAGGMGRVYLVERSGDGYVQQGALKLIKRGMDSDALVARFRRERHILARLDHPSIARLLDGGIASDGRPFLVMEFVEGEPLSAWITRADVGLDARVSSWLAIAAAVAHAHRQLVVHRDIKPANVLVDADGQPRLLDFGIARLLEADTLETQTATASRFVSRAYAAPEQLNGRDVTTATDVYQLGALLFEMLSGERFTTFASEVAVRPSLALARARERAGITGPPITSRRLSGDAGIIVARATDADPSRRYATVAAFADDVKRWRDGLPILARPDSARYRIGRFVQRHRVAVALGVFALCALLVGFALALWQAQRAAEEARLARAAQDVLIGVFDAAAPDAAAGTRVTARELIDRGIERIDTDLADQPRLRAEMLLTLGTLYRQLGLYDQAATTLGRALDVATGHDRFDTRVVARTRLELAGTERERQRLDAASGLIEAVLADPPDERMRARALIERAQVNEKLSRFDEALADARAASDLDTSSADAAARAKDRQIEALILTRTGRFDEAAGVFDDAIATATRALGANDTRVAQIRNDYAMMLTSQSRPADGEREARASLDARRARLGNTHALVAESLQVLGSAERQLGRLDDAERSFEEALAIQRTVFGDVHGDVANTQNSLGILAASRNRFADAERHFREASATQRAIGQDTTVPSSVTSANLAVALLRQGKLDEAEALLESAAAMQRTLLGERHPAMANTENGLSQVALRRGDFAAAIAHARAAASIFDAALRPGRETAAVHLVLALALERAGEAEEALAEVLGARTMLENAGVTGDPRLFMMMIVEADALVDLGRVADAVPIARRVVDERADAEPGLRIPTLALAARVAQADGRAQDARRLRDEARALLTTIVAPDPELALDITRD